MQRRNRKVLLAGGLLAALGALALSVNTDWAAGADGSVAEWFDAHRTRHEERSESKVFAYIGRPLHVLVAAAVCGSALSVLRRSLLPVAVVSGAVGVSVIVEHTLKAVVERTALSPWMVDYFPKVHYAHSFPSGHVAGAAALLGSIAVCAGMGLSRAGKTALGALVAGCVVGVAYLALYVGAHTFTDVIGGMLLGGAIVALCAAVVAVFQSGSPVPSVGAEPTGARA